MPLMAEGLWVPTWLSRRRIENARMPLNYATPNRPYCQKPAMEHWQKERSVETRPGRQVVNYVRSYRPLHQTLEPKASYRMKFFTAYRILADTVCSQKIHRFSSATGQAQNLAPIIPKLTITGVNTNSFIKVRFGFLMLP